MKSNSRTKTPFSRLLETSVVCILLLVGASLRVTAEPPVVTTQETQETLLDRIQIEDMLLAYYHGFESEESHDWAALAWSP